MGSGSRVKFGRNDWFTVGAVVHSFPFALTITIHLMVWYVQIGIGKGYDHE